MNTIYFKFQTIVFPFFTVLADLSMVALAFSAVSMLADVFLLISYCMVRKLWPNVPFSFMTTCFVYIIARFFGWKWVKDRYTLNENRIRFRFIIGVVFKLVSKAIRNWTGFALLWSVIGPKNSPHPLDQSDVKLKPFTSWSPTRFLPTLWAVIWLTKVFSLLLIGSRNYFGFGFTTLNRKALYKEIYRLAC